jgi:hypothetical protein
MHFKLVGPPSVGPAGWPAQCLTGVFDRGRYGLKFFFSLAMTPVIYATREWMHTTFQV